MRKKKKKNSKNWLKRAEALKFPKEDKLFKEYFANVKNLILSVESPFVIGVSGEWGRGKTTLFNFLNEELKNKFAIVRFESWRNQRSGNLSYAFVENIYANAKIWRLRIFSRRTLAWAKNIFEVSVSLGPINIKPKISETKILDSFENRFSKLVNRILKIEKRSNLIIFVDDLDRCLPEFSLDFLENIKHFFSVDNVIFVIALDEELLETALQKRYNSDSQFTSKVYLEKIIDLFLSLPNYEAKNLKEYVTFILRERYPLENILTEEYISNMINMFDRVSETESSRIATNPRKLDRALKNMIIGIKILPENSISNNSYIISFIFLIMKEYYKDIFDFSRKSITNNKCFNWLWTVVKNRKFVENELKVISFSNIDAINELKDKLKKYSDNLLEPTRDLELNELIVLLMETFYSEIMNGSLTIAKDKREEYFYKLANEINQYF